MRYKIIGDSCLDLTEDLKKDSHFEMIPFTLMVGDKQFIDDESFNQKECPECPKTACPSPEMFKEAYHCEEENVFVITISGPLSGSYNSAVLAKTLYEEEYGKKNIAVINSESASSGQMSIALLIKELCEQGLPFEEVEKRALAYRDEKERTFDGASGVFCDEVKYQAGHERRKGRHHQVRSGPRHPEGPSEDGGDYDKKRRGHGLQAAGDFPLQRAGAGGVCERKALFHGEIPRGADYGDRRPCDGVCK